MPLAPPRLAYLGSTWQEHHIPLTLTTSLLLPPPTPPHTPGLTRESIQKEDRQRSLLATVLQYHVLPPLKGSGAVWSAPFMRPGEKLATALPDGSTITVAGGEGEGASLSDYHPVKLVAPKSSAEIEVPDIYVCKVGVARWRALCDDASTLTCTFRVVMWRVVGRVVPSLCNCRAWMHA